jgi:hypothetical protein
MSLPSALGLHTPAGLCLRVRVQVELSAQRYTLDHSLWFYASPQYSMSAERDGKYTITLFLMKPQ